MGLLRPIKGARVTQGFGPGIDREPPMWVSGSRAWWNQFAGAHFVPHMHSALDYGGVSPGVPILASEAGVVVESYFDFTFGGGNKVRVQIRPGTSYCSNHMATRAVKVGQHVTKGQVIGTMGSTGNSTAAHDHFWLGIDDEIGSNDWPSLYDPTPFFVGGSKANDPRIQPLEVVRQVRVNGPGVNIREAALRSPGEVWAFTTENGIFRRSTGNRIGALSYRFTFVRWQESNMGDFAIVTGFNRRLAIRKSLVHFV